MPCRCCSHRPYGLSFLIFSKMRTKRRMNRRWVRLQSPRTMSMKLPEISLKIEHIAEPPLEFAYGQFNDHPKDGLFLYGPHGGPPATRHITIGVIGTDLGVSLFPTWLKSISRLLM